MLGIRQPKSLCGGIIKGSERGHEFFFFFRFCDKDFVASVWIMLYAEESRLMCSVEPA